MLTRSATHPFSGLDLAALLDLRARERGTHPFLVWSPFDGPSQSWSYARFADEVGRLAGGLATRGIGKGDRVMVVLENCLETLLTLFACARLGAVYVPINAMLPGPELAWYARFLGPAGAITQPKLASELEHHCPDLPWVAVTETDAGTPPTSGNAPERPAAFRSLFADPLPGRASDPLLPALIMFTSGTTSHPKAVLWTHANALWGARLGALHQALRTDDVCQIFLPLFHVVGLSWCFLPALWAGATVVLQPRFSASRYWPAALEHGATMGSQVLFTARVLSQQPVPVGHRFRQWINAQCLSEYESHFGVRIVGAWGMTEVVSQCIVGDPWQAQPAGSIGRPSPGYRVRIVDDAARLVAPGQTGHLLIGGVRGLSIFAEYFADPEATAQAFDEAGYFRTGDRVILREDGFIEFSEREKDLIKVGGESVAPAEIEHVIMQLPGIHEAAVVGKPDPDYGEVPVAFVVPKAAQTDLAARVLAHCNASLARFKLPREVIVIAELPRINFGKVSKALLRERLK
jgi:carnitine-CoA ligase